MTNPPTDERREAFEQWALDNGHPTTTRDDGTDRYVSTLTALRWQGWQAALSHQGEVVKVSDEDVSHLVEEIAKVLSGAPFPSPRSYAKARQVMDLISKAEKV